MIALKGIIQNGQVVFTPARPTCRTVPKLRSCRAGRPGRLASPRRSGQRSPRASPASWPAMNLVEPFDTSPKEEADLETWRQKVKEYTAAKPGTGLSRNCSNEALSASTLTRPATILIAVSGSASGRLLSLADVALRTGMDKAVLLQAGERSARHAHAALARPYAQAVGLATHLLADFRCRGADKSRARKAVTIDRWEQNGTVNCSFEKYDDR